ncbi:MAG TPA: hypothetical protein VI299_20650 [Polyangiales bacterium]
MTIYLVESGALFDLEGRLFVEFPRAAAEVSRRVLEVDPDNEESGGGRRWAW